MYEVSFATLSERFYKTSPWPPVELIADYVDNDHVFCILYKARPGPALALSRPHLLACTHSSSAGLQVLCNA